MGHRTVKRVPMDYGGSARAFVLEMFADDIASREHDRQMAEEAEQQGEDK